MNAPCALYAAVLTGTNPGSCYVDSPLYASSGFVFSPEACYLRGHSGNAEFCTNLKTLLLESSNLGAAAWHLDFVVVSESWRQRLSEIAGSIGMEVTQRRLMRPPLGS